jgi:excisionase family DNA binding protein
MDMACKSHILGGFAERRCSAGTAHSCCSAWRRLRIRACLSGGSYRGTRFNSLAAWRVLWSVTAGDRPKHACSAMRTRPHQHERTSETTSRERRSSSSARRSVPLTTAEVAAALGVHERTVRRYLSAGLLAFRRLPGGHYRVPTEALDEFWRADAALQTPSALRTSRQARQRSPSSGNQLRLGLEAPEDYDLSPATLRAVRDRLSETPAPTVASIGAHVDNG